MTAPTAATLFTVRCLACAHPSQGASITAPVDVATRWLVDHLRVAHHEMVPSSFDVHASEALGIVS